MIISRTSFRLKFGQSKPAVAIWKEIMDHTKGKEYARPMQLMTDLSGPNYTLVCDFHLRGFTELGTSMHLWLSDPLIRELYPKFVLLCESSTSELYHVEHQVGTTPVAAGNVVELMTFRLRFGQAREACAIWKEIITAGGKTGLNMRLYTDITGESYTLLMDQHYHSMLEYGPRKYFWMTDPHQKEAYKRFVPLCESANRTLFTMVHHV